VAEPPSGAPPVGAVIIECMADVPMQPRVKHVRGQKLWRADKAMRPEEAFAALCSIEPRLDELRADILALKPKRGKPWCSNARWYGFHRFAATGYKARMMGLVGHFAENPELRTSAAYDVAYEVLFKLLPPCRGCACVALDIALGLRRPPRSRR
jgi:hypothetical protein